MARFLQNLTGRLWQDGVVALMGIAILLLAKMPKKWNTKHEISWWTQYMASQSKRNVSIQTFPQLPHISYDCRWWWEGWWLQFIQVSIGNQQALHQKIAIQSTTLHQVWLYDIILSCNYRFIFKISVILTFKLWQGLQFRWPFSPIVGRPLASFLFAAFDWSLAVKRVDPVYHLRCHGDRFE